MLKEAGAEPYNYGIVKDNKEEIKNILEKSLKECDIVLISGGSSVGERDHTISAIESVEGSEILVHGLAIKPGKPTIIAKNGNKLIFGLPGNPFAVLAVFKVLIEQYISGFIEKERFFQAVFSINYHKAMGRTEFLPVNMREENGELYVDPIMAKSSSVVALTKADGFISIEKNKEGIYRGEIVKVYEL